MTDILNKSSDLDSRTERAQNAVKVFRSMQPQLTAYVRAITKKRDLSVRMAEAGQSSGYTDGRNIYFVPPIALGDLRPHKRSLCDKRGEDGQQLCEACQIREGVLAIIYHEMAHICFNSFAPVSDADKANLTALAAEEGGSKFAKDLAERYEQAPSYVKNSYKGLATLFNEFLPLISNALEDARVNREMFIARKGIKAMLEARSRKTFVEGVEQRNAEGELVKIQWKDYSLNLQIIVGCYVRISDYDYAGWFHPKVEADLEDEGLNQVLKQMNTVRGPGPVYNLSFKVLEEIRRLGYCKSENDPEPEPEEGDDAQGEKPSSESDESSTDSESEYSGEEDGNASESESDAEDNSPDDSQGDGDSGAESDSEGESEDARDDSPTEDGVSSVSKAGYQDSDQDGSDPSGDSDPSSESPSEEEVGSGDGSPEEDESRDSSGLSNDGEGSESSDTGDGEAGSQDSAGSYDSPSEDGDGGGEDLSVRGSDSNTESEELSEDSDMVSDPSESEDQLASSADAGDGSESNNSSGLDAEGDLTDESDSGGESSPVQEREPVGSNDEQPPVGSESIDDSDPSEEAFGQAEGGSPGPDSSHNDSPSPDDDDSPDGAERAEGPLNEDVEPIDTGADEGYGGVEVDDLPDPGTADGIADELAEWIGHGEFSHEEIGDTAGDESAVRQAIIQGVYFETPSQTVCGVHEYEYDTLPRNFSGGWDHRISDEVKVALGADGDIDVPESRLGSALLRMRVAFSDNKRAQHQRNLKSGKVNARVLGKRAFNNDPRLFKRSVLPGKRDYFVAIAMDISGSTAGVNILLMKRAVMSQAILLDRMGIRFSIFAHTANNYYTGLHLDVYHVKHASEPWSTKVQTRLRELCPVAGNLDGHAMEFLRKTMDREVATDKIGLYYSDGKMPAANHDEELEILQREIKVCDRSGYTLLGVGIRTDSPRRHGLDTVQVDGDEDLIGVVRHIEKRLILAR